MHPTRDLLVKQTTQLVNIARVPLFEEFLARRGERVTIVGATSGDTGSAAVDAVAGREGIDIFMLHPKRRVSEVQRLRPLPRGDCRWQFRCSRLSPARSE